MPTPPATQPTATPADSAAERSRYALASSGYRLFLAGSVVSWVGDWMDLAAINWAVLQLTDSPLALGLINACRLLPVFALSIPAGVLADRGDRRRLLILTQVALAGLTFLVGWLVFAQSNLWWFGAVVAVRAAVAAIGVPVRNALLPTLVPPSAIAAAVATQTAAMNLARIVGPAIAGGLLAVLPVHTVLWINAASFAAIVGTLLAVRVPPRPAVARKGVLADVGEAVGYIRRNRLVRSLLVLAVAPMIFGFPYTALMPVFARDLYGVGPGRFGLLLSSSAVGALLGSTWLSLRSGGPRGAWTGPLLIGSLVGFGLGLLAAVATGGFAVAAVAFFVVGLCSQLYRTASRIALQLEVPDELRGRILSIALMDRGFIPLGTVMLGAVAEFAGATWTGVVMGVGCIAVPLATVAIDRTVWRLGREG